MKLWTVQFTNGESATFTNAVEMMEAARYDQTAVVSEVTIDLSTKAVSVETI